MDDLAVHERHRRGVLQVDADTAILLVDLDVKVRIQLLRGARVVGGAAAGHDRQRATAQQIVHAATGRIGQARDFLARKNVQPPARMDPGVDGRQDGVAGMTHLRVFPCCIFLDRGTLTQTHENGRVSPAASVVHRPDRNQNLYLKLNIIDQRDTAVLPLSLLFSWTCALSVEPEKL